MDLVIATSAKLLFAGLLGNVLMTSSGLIPSPLTDSAGLHELVGGAHKIPFYIGTYTSKQGSHGIYWATLDSRTGELSIPELVATTESPSYLALSPGGKRLYAANELDNGQVTAFDVAAEGKLHLLNTQSVGVGAPCFLSVDGMGKSLLVANYTGGILTSFPIVADGRLGEEATRIHNSGTGPDKSRQDASHMHWVSTGPKSKFAYSCDLGTDKVQVYRFDPASSKITEAPELAGTSEPGSGPRHGVFHPRKPLLYVNNEMANTVSVFSIQSKTGGLTRIQTISTLPEGPHPFNTTSEIALDPTNRWLYVSNRGHDSIAVYRVGPKGLLSLVQIEKVGVRMPRGFAIDPTGHWLVVAGQDSNDLVALKLNPLTGELQGGFKKVSLSKPVCVLFAP